MVIGSSPRMRGTDWRAARAHARERFIPAHAGNRRPAPAKLHSTSVHPRACGEQRMGLRKRRYGRGSSPRMRGTGRSSSMRYRPDRFIPAHAGNSASEYDREPMPPVHPRACGEQGRRQAFGNPKCGSSPRMRGTGAVGKFGRDIDRFIPAHAGNSCAWPAWRSAKSVHPRACGEQSGARWIALAKAGSSPRMRGTGMKGPQHERRQRFIPAHAGNSQCRIWRPALRPVHPRACGEQSSSTR